MSFARCNQGHYFDALQHSSCPYCSGQVSLSTQHSPGAGHDIPKTGHLGANKIPVTVKRNEDNKTVGIMQAKTGIDPVVGWLVCVEGAGKGQDYRIMSGQNSIGRGDNMHVRIKGDDSISREKHAVIIYDSKNNRFFIQGGEGRDLVYVNGAPVLSVMELHAYDAIEMGRSKLLFVPFCGEEYKWE